MDVDGKAGKRAMLEWVDDHAAGIMQALGKMRDACFEHAAAIRTDLPALAEVARESGRKWSDLLVEFTRLYEALPDREMF